MSNKHFCLKWNSFQTSILSAFESLQNTEDLADVTLTCDGINLKAHKFILSACSPYFRTVFKENPCSHPIVILKDVTYTNLVAIVNFMYHGEVMIAEDQLSSFLETAILLQVTGLIKSNENNVNNETRKRAKTLHQITTDQIESPTKKSKICSKYKKAIDDSRDDNYSKPLSPTRLDCEVDIKTESHDSFDEECNQLRPDVNENVDVMLTEKNDQGSILEAALEIRDKPSSILERSLMANASLASKPNVVFPPVEKPSPDLHVLTDIKKSLFIPRKPPELDCTEKESVKSSESVSPTIEQLQPYIKIEEEESCESHPIISPDGDPRFQIARSNDIHQQAHHSSQCGNCPHCGKVYSNQSALKYHVRLVHSDLTNMYCCHLCPESFDYREGYKKHMAEAHFIRN